MKDFNLYFQAVAFNCPLCGVKATFVWRQANLGLYSVGDLIGPRREVHLSTCANCGEALVWYDKKMVYPETTYNEVGPHKDMPESVKLVFNEAASVYYKSPRAAAALLRLALQVLLKELGEKGDNINYDIGQLVAKGLHPTAQQVMDMLRIVGNEAVHPGEIRFDERPEVAAKLFEFINYIVQEMITRPKETATLYNNWIPPATQAKILDRNENAKSKVIKNSE